MPKIFDPKISPEWGHKYTRPGHHMISAEFLYHLSETHLPQRFEQAALMEGILFDLAYPELLKILSIARELLNYNLEIPTDKAILEICEIQYRFRKEIEELDQKYGEEV